jgi:fatty-acyl-CoA synthase
MTTFTRVLLDNYQASPDQTALTLLFNRQPPIVWKYRDLIFKAAGYAAALEKSGVLPGEVVILIHDHGEDLAAAFFGAVLHGAVPSIMPFLTEKLAPDQYRSSLAALFEICTPAAIATYPEFVEEVRRATGEHNSLRAVFVSGDIPPQPNPDLERLPGLKCSPDDIVLLQHSSGTTGLQKGVALSHRAVFNQLDSYARSLRLEADDVIVSWLPLYHDMGLIAGFLMPILLRVPLVLMSPFDWVRAPYRLLQAISQYHGTLCWLPNFAYNFCAQKVRNRDLEGVDLSSLRAAINCSEPTYWSSHQMFLERFQPYGLQGSALATCYAMAENVFAVTQSGIETPTTVDRVDQQSLLTRQVAAAAASDEPALDMLSAGKPIEGTAVRVIDPQGRDLPERHIGEIALQSDCMLTGYYRRPDLTEQAFLDGWYLTGDLGYLAGGELYVTGRKKDLIIVGGKNIYPQDLERLASEVEGVHPGRMVAFGVFNEQAGTEDVIIVAEVDSVDLVERQRIAEAVRSRVTQGSDISVRQVAIVGRGWLLKTSSGKVARRANREKYILHTLQR